MNVNYQLRLTAAKVRSAKCGKRPDGSPVMKRYQDGNGLMLQVNPPSARYPAGSRQWVQRIAIHGKRVDFGLGGYPLVTLKEARDQAFENRRIARQGGDPRVKPVAVPTFAEAARTVHGQRAHHNKDRDRDRWLSEIARHVFPALADRPIDQITTGDVLRVFEAFWHSSPTVAKRVRQRVSLVFQWAIGHGFRKDDPADSIGAVLGKANHVVKHHEAVPHGEVAQAIATIRGSVRRMVTLKLVFEYMILTATRPNEAIGARWDEIDLEGRVWTIPASRMLKTKQDHRIPLSDRAIEILEQARPLSRNGLVFPNRVGKVFDEKKLATTARELKLGGKPHGFRSSFRDWATEIGGVSWDVAEACLSHKVENSVSLSYDHSDRFGLRVPVMQAWADYLKQ